MYNISHYQNEAYDALLSSLNGSHDRQQLLNQYANAEGMLMDDAVAFPLLAETSYFVMGSGVSGIEFYPYGGKVIFRDALAMR